MLLLPLEGGREGGKIPSKKHREVQEIYHGDDDDLEVNFFSLISYKFEQRT